MTTLGSGNNAPFSHSSNCKTVADSTQQRNVVKLNRDDYNLCSCNFVVESISGKCVILVVFSLNVWWLFLFHVHVFSLSLAKSSQKVASR